MSGFEAIVGLIGTGLSAVGSIAAGNAQNEALQAQAAAEERKGNEARAATQREAIQRAKEARLALSRQQAVASASGAGATDPTVLKLMGDVGKQGQYNVASTLYEGEAIQAGMQDQAAISRMRGRQARLAGFIGAGTTMLNGLSGFADTWGGFSSSGSSTGNYRYQ